MITDESVCYRHADHRAAVGCQRCDRPICSQCMTSASVGFHCPECLSAGKQRVYRASDLASRPTFVFGLIGLCVAVYLGQMVTDANVVNGRGWVTSEGILFGPFVQDGEYWRIVTSAFLHADLIHLGFNMYALYIFGPLIQQAIGLGRSAMVYVGAMFAASAAVLLFNWTSPTLGASGAVLGLAGGLAALMMLRGINIFRTSFGTIFLINLALPLFTNISFWGHFGGIVGGFAVAWVLVVVEHRMNRSRAEAMIAAGALTAAFLVLAVVGSQLELTPIL